MYKKIVSVVLREGVSYVEDAKFYLQCSNFNYMHQYSDSKRLYYNIRALAREMRENSTPAEEIFWYKVRNRQLFGLKWNRQFVIECQRDLIFKKYYIADFHCHALKLIVEIDGEIHNNQESFDLVRTDELNEFGYKVERFTNDQIINN